MPADNNSDPLTLQRLLAFVDPRDGVMKVLEVVDTGTTVGAGEYAGLPIFSLGVAAGGGATGMNVIITDPTSGDEAEVDAGTKAFKVLEQGALSGYEAGPDAFVFVPGARAGYEPYEDASFVAGDSPRILDVNTDLGRNGHDGYIIIDGAGDLLVEISSDGAAYGNQFTVTQDEITPLEGFDINKICLTHSGTDTAYRIMIK